MTRTGENPWLSIPAADYEGHMGSPAVRQLQYLGDVFRETIGAFRPQSLAVLGCATGNGFERIPRDTRRVLGIDINRAYLDTLRERHGAALPGLELICADLADCDLGPEALDLVHAALVFEYVDPAAVVGKLARWLGPGGALSVVLQLPAGGSSPVTETEYESLMALEPIMRCVEPRAFEDLAAREGFTVRHSRVDTLATGKRFHVGWFVKGTSARKINGGGKTNGRS